MKIISEFIKSIYNNRNLIYAIAKRDVESRYKGTILGLLWAMVTPLIAMSIYIFVFGTIFNAKWVKGEDGVQYVLLLYMGLIIFNCFSECINRAPMLVLSNSNYVKKIIFPLEVLSVSSALSSLFQVGLSMIIWLIIYLFAFGSLNLTVLFAPIILIELAMLCVGIGLILSSVGVFVRDLTQIMSSITSMLLFLSPVLYPVSSIPEEYRGWIYLNPLVQIIESIRLVMFYGKVPDPYLMLSSMFIQIIIFLMGIYWFQKTKKGFADVM
jgi:lipopolysaccharide transport system permease protein